MSTNNPRAAAEAHAADCREAHDAGGPPPAYCVSPLRDAIMCDAIGYCANLHRANLRGANLHRANLARVFRAMGIRV